MKPIPQPVPTLRAESVSRTDPDRAFLRSRMLRGSVVLLTSTGLVSVTNLLYNIAIARGLGPAGFGHATAIYTLLMLLSAVTLAYQLVCSKLIAKSPDVPTGVGIYRDLLRRSWQTGILLGVLIASASIPIARYLHLPTPRDISLLGLATAIYVPLGVRRGMLQGTYDFVRLAINFVLEALIKIMGAVAFLHFGFGVTGVIAAVVLSIVIAYGTAYPGIKVTASSARVNAPFREGMQATAFFVGQVIISNLDILLVKHYFTPEVAGLYAAVALVGRVVYMFAWSVVSSMFPVSAATVQQRSSRGVLQGALLVVVGMTSTFTLVVWLAPMSLWKLILGNTFLRDSHIAFSSLLGSYSAMTSVYSIAVVLLTYEISRKIANTTWIQLGFSALLPVGIVAFHDSLYQVIAVQLFLMVGLLAAVSLPFVTDIVSRSDEQPDIMRISGLQKVRRVAEPEVIAEFLKAEFYQPEFDRYREKFTQLVVETDFSNERENAIRRTLLFRRRGRLWRELPADTQWWEVKIQPSDLPRLRAFPRKQWRKFAAGSFYLTRMIERIRATVESQDRSWFSEKMRSVVADLQGKQVPNSVLLIGVDDIGPLTIIEGNHRMAAAMLLSPERVSETFRFYCGFSPHMTLCCWYRTDFRSLSRYARNVIRYLLHDRDYFVQRILAEKATES